MKGEVDKRLREDRGGYRQDRSCICQIAALPTLWLCSKTIDRMELVTVRQLC